jgi:hypothetical protein
MRTQLLFDGPVALHEIGRLQNQNEAIRELMLDGKWRTLRDIAETTGYPEASVSAQLRHLRKERFGSYRVDKRRVSNTAVGLWEYQVTGEHRA